MTLVCMWLCSKTVKTLEIVLCSVVEHVMTPFRFQTAQKNSTSLGSSTWQFENSDLVYTISDYFSCRIIFLNPVQKTLRSMSVYTKPGKQPSDTISCQNNFITSTIFAVFFAYLPINRSTSFALKPSCYQSEIWKRFVSDYDVFTWNKTVQIVPDPFSYHLLMRSRVVPDC